VENERLGGIKIFVELTDKGDKAPAELAVVDDSRQLLPFAWEEKQQIECVDLHRLHQRGGSRRQVPRMGDSLNPLPSSYGCDEHQYEDRRFR